MNDITDLLAAREATHGDAWEITGEVVRKLGGQRLLLERPWMFLSFCIIVAKLARIGTGNYDVIDHWVDIEGYAHLVSTRLKETHSKEQQYGT